MWWHTPLIPVLWEAEAGGSLRVQGHLGVCDKTLPEKKNKKINKSTLLKITGDGVVVARCLSG